MYHSSETDEAESLPTIRMLIEAGRSIKKAVSSRKTPRDAL